jgi:peptidoglycan/LPS O-acetylase OafA/YrhL
MEIPVISPEAAKPQPVTTGLEHIHTIDALRDIAALSVCWFHYTNAQFVERFGAYRSTGRYGYLGVHVFFVISGFIIPFALFRACYQIGSFFRFFLRRVTRLDPPYLASVLVVILGYWLSGALPGRQAYQVSWPQVFAHFAYVNAFLGMPWLQMSYWSLAIEFQYYIFVGLLFPLLALRQRATPVLILALFGALTFVAGKSSALLPHYLPLFAIGILTFRHICLKVPALDTFIALLAAVALTAWADGTPEAIVAAASSAVILFAKINTPVLNFFGEISYSLYLIHVFVGNVVFGLAVRWASRLTPNVKWILPFFAAAMAIAAAYLLYCVVESPSRRWAARISYGRR